MFEKTCCDKNMVEPFTCGQLRLDVQRLTTQLADRDAEIARIQTISDNYFALATDRFLEITTLRTKLAECEKEVERLNQMLHQTSQGNAELIGEVIQEARKQAARECIAIVDSYIGTDHICAEIAETFGLEGKR